MAQASVILIERVEGGWNAQSFEYPHRVDIFDESRDEAISRALVELEAVLEEEQVNTEKEYAESLHRIGSYAGEVRDGLVDAGFGKEISTSLAIDWFRENWMRMK